LSNFYIRVYHFEIFEPFHAPTKIQINSNKIQTFPLPKCDVKLFYENSVGLSFEAEAVRQSIINGNDFFTRMFIYSLFPSTWPS